MMPKFKTPTEGIKYLQVSLECADKGIKEMDEKIKQRDMESWMRMIGGLGRWRSHLQT